MSKAARTDAALETFEEGRLFGGEWLRSLEMIPNEYLYYFYYSADTVNAIRQSPESRGAFLLRSTMDPPWSLRIQDEAPLTLVAVVPCCTSWTRSPISRGAANPAWSPVPPARDS